ncbi:MAG: serine protease [Bacteroidia bacterium]|nr:MAG: serine protease [Bacteroidia bacterium]
MFYKINFLTKILCFTLFFAYSPSLFSQKIAPDIYVIKFKDKKHNIYHTDKPEEFLSAEALERRKRFSIPVTSEDLPVSKAYMDKIEDMGFQIYATSKWLNSVLVFSKDSTLWSKAQKLDFVASESPKKKSKKRTKLSRRKKINIEGTQEDHCNLKYGKSKRQITMLHLENLHNKGYLGEGIRIALLDAGFYNVDSITGFDSLRTNKQILGTKDFVDRENEVYRNGSHGMNALSTIAGYIPGKFIGSAPKASFWLLRTEDGKSETPAEEYYWAAAAEFADSCGVDMIHSSLGYNNFDDKNLSYTYSDMNGDIAISTIAADIAASKGILVTISAGNEGNDPWKYISAPADADSVLAVGAVNMDGSIARFSSHGPTSDGRIKPDALAHGSFVFVLGKKGKPRLASGTSFSAPLLAGAVACLWQANPECSNMEIIEAIQKSGKRYLKPDSKYGYGLPNIDKADKYLKSKKKKEGKRKRL